MDILVACEYSGRVRDAFRAKGHNAWSCDLLPTEADARYHIQGDVLDVLNDGWDMLIGFPECTFLCNSGVRWLYSDPLRWQKMISGAVFFRTLWQADIEKVCLENPIMHKYAKQIIGGTQTQIVQPWMFGEKEKKATCLWVDGMDALKPTNNVKEETDILPLKEQQRIFYMSRGNNQGNNRGHNRSKTFQGIADAMAEQWG